MENYSIPNIIEKVKSGIIHIIHVVDGKRVSSGTGFMVNGYLVTNYHVIYDSPKNSKIVLRTYDADSNKPLEGIIELNRGEEGYFLGKTNKDDIEEDFIKEIEPDNQGDYVVYNIPELIRKKPKLYNFSFASHKCKRIGEEILFLGYHFDHSRIVSHRGFISSFYNENNLDKIQIDASVNYGSSGSPLIDPITCKVIGIITRKESGLSEDLKKLIKNLEDTKKILENHRIQIQSENDFFQLAQDRQRPTAGSIILNNQDILTTHNNMQNIENNKRTMSALTTNLSNSITELSKMSETLIDLTKEIKRSANVGIGYAFSVENLQNKDSFCVQA